MASAARIDWEAAFAYYAELGWQRRYAGVAERYSVSLTGVKEHADALALRWGPEGLDLADEPPVARIVRASTKTAAGAREVPLDRETAALLRRHRLACGRPGDGLRRR